LLQICLSSDLRKQNVISSKSIKNDQTVEI
jgi:hypothetical protein